MNSSKALKNALSVPCTGITDTLRFATDLASDGVGETARDELTENGDEGGCSDSERCDPDRIAWSLSLPLGLRNLAWNAAFARAYSTATRLSSAKCRGETREAGVADVVKTRREGGGREEGKEGGREGAIGRVVR